MALVLDSGAISRLAERTRYAAALISALRDEGLWPPIVPSMVLVECLQGHAGRDALENRFLKTCDMAESVGEALGNRSRSTQRRASGSSAQRKLICTTAGAPPVSVAGKPRARYH